MRVAIVEPVGRGGLVHYAFQLARAMAAEGADVTLVTDRDYELAAVAHPFALARPLRLWDPKPTPERSGRPRRTLRRAGRGARYLWEWLRLTGWLRRGGFDVVQLGDVRFPLELPFVRRLRAAAPVLADVCHNVHPFAQGGRDAGRFRRDRLTRATYRKIYHQFDRVFVHFERNRRAMLDAYGLPPDHVESIALGDQGLFRELRDPAVDAPVLRRRLGLPPEAPVVLMFGTLSPYKGVDVLLEAFARVAADHPDARLVIAGFPLPGFDLAAAGTRAAALGVAPRTVWAPAYVPSSEVAAWMDLATVAAFPYRGGWQSAAVQTALTFGVPVVASAVGAMPDLLASAGGALVPPGEVAPLAVELDRLLGDPELAARRGKAAARAVAERCAWSRPAGSILASYQALLAGRTGGEGER